MKSETTLIWQWLRINVPTILAIGGLVWYTAQNNAATYARLHALENSSAGITASVNALVARVEPLGNVTYRVQVLETQAAETSKRIDRFSETIVNSLDLIRRDVNGVSTRIEVLSQKIDSLPSNTSGNRRAETSPVPLFGGAIIQ